MGWDLEVQHEAAEWREIIIKAFAFGRLPNSPCSMGLPSDHSLP